MENNLVLFTKEIEQLTPENLYVLRRYFEKLIDRQQEKKPGKQNVKTESYLLI